MAQHGQELVLGAAPRLGLGTGIPLCLVEPRVLDRDGGLRREPDHDALRVVREHPGLGVPEEEPAQDLAGAPPHGDRQVARDRQAPHRRAAVRHVPPVTRVLRHVVEAYDALPRERGREERRVPRRAELYRWPGIKETLDLQKIKSGYYGQLNVNPTGIVPLGPNLDHLELPHDRNRLRAAA